MDDDAIYDLSPDTATAGRSVATPAKKSAAAPVTLAYRAAKPAPMAAPGRLDTDAVKNLHMPLWLLAGGVLIEFVAVLLRSHDAAQACLELTVELFLGTAVMLAGILIAARMRQIDLGPFWTAVFKLSAISVAPSALGALAAPMLAFVPLGGLLGLAIEFALYFALLGALFDLDESDTWVCVWTIFLVRVAVYLALVHFLP